MLAINQDLVDEYIARGLKEDVPYEDVTTQAIYMGQQATVQLLAKESGIICGLAVFERVFQYLDPQTTCQWLVQEGDAVNPNDQLMQITGSVNTLLTGERVALNFLQRMSGIATLTHCMVQALEGSTIKLLDTRKTTPGYRLLEKYAVRIGGGYNHRFSLSEAIMLKDNHIEAAGGVIPAIKAARAYSPFIKKIEVEVETLEMVKEAIHGQADIIMLDNMSHEAMAEALKWIDGRAIVEASGNFTLDNISEYKDLPLDYISSGEITHSARCLDLSMKHLQVI
ncbi:nicotinate-nucleotide diphosphorylase (carboxylating) [Aerococcus christensenii]|uniref:Probable nicotinate-nucleotide pyrophosphorylase [carboxylating] n=2 Tax=Aerococcus christensenii TaxID=87541 RepID=A0A0X8F795_9LACT|nr:carboxylating nicotinate-nucleotide diphosphorylase [Aerococcus christensenii]AMB91924.1 nicotinate-nucleotide pyrophosphorylase [Aerococcus christensenii]PKY91246.1 nicotinate-nucleotide diphosphorylase (carboxylating) [Aerococcus christensenii]WEB70333.1 carboxylating nicotinate-nucleotide diphosphorylase [Aerococcus christensenii]